MRILFLIIIFFACLSASSQNTFRYIDLDSLKWGLKDFSGKTIIDARYSKIDPLKNGRYVVSKKPMQQGIIDEKGNEILACEYFSIYDEAKDTIIVRKGGKQGVLNTQLDWIIPLKYKYLLKQKESYIVAEENLVGILDANLNLTVPMMYSTIYYPNSLENDYFLVKKGSKSGLIDINNNIIIPIEHDFLSYMESFNYYIGGNAVGVLESQTKVFDSEAKVILSLNNNGVNILTKDRFAVKNNKNLWGVFDKKSKQKIDYQYNMILASEENFYIVQNNELKWGAIDDENNIIIPFLYSEYFNFQYSEPFHFEAKATFVKNKLGKYGFIDKKGIATTEFKYDSTIRLSNGCFLVKIDNKSGLVDKNGKELIKPFYDFINTSSDDILIVGKDKKYYFLKLDNLSVDNKIGYDYIDSFMSNDSDKEFILVRKDGLYGFIDINENIVIPIIYENARPFIDNFASVKLNGKNYIINKSGEKLLHL